MYAGVDEGSKRSIMQKKLDDMTLMITTCGLCFGVGESLCVSGTRRRFSNMSVV